MNPVAQKYGASGFPEVNLVPKEIDEKRTMRIVQFGSVLGVLAVIVLLALGYLGALASKSVASDKLNQAFADEDAALTERNAKSDVYTQYVTREEEEFALLAIGWGEMDNASLMTALLAQDDPETALVSFNIAGPNVSATGGSKMDPTLSGGVGRLTFKASARTYEAAIALAARFETIPGVARVHITQQAFGPDHGNDYWLVDGTAVVTDTFLTRRLMPQDGLFASTVWEAFIDAVIAESMVPEGTTAVPVASPEPSPTATPSAEEE